MLRRVVKEIFRNSSCVIALIKGTAIFLTKFFKSLSLHISDDYIFKKKRLYHYHC